MTEKVKKRNGRTEKFSRHKLLQSLHHALRMARRKDAALEERITEVVIRRLKHRKVINAEDIRKNVCTVLRKNRHHEICDYYELVWLHSRPVRIKAVIKRSGRKERFSPEKLFRSVLKSFKHAGVEDGLMLQKAVQDILKLLRNRYAGKEVHTEAIRELTELVLMRRKLPVVAKRYVLYRYS